MGNVIQSLLEDDLYTMSKIDASEKDRRKKRFKEALRAAARKRASEEEPLPEEEKDPEAALPQAREVLASLQQHPALFWEVARLFHTPSLLLGGPWTERPDGSWVRETLAKMLLARVRPASEGDGWVVVMPPLRPQGQFSLEGAQLICDNYLRDEKYRLVG